jgi:hypothetical protein
MRIPDIFYADDVLLAAINNPEEMQGLLNATELFGYLFDMDVSLLKTKMMIVRGE